MTSVTTRRSSARSSRAAALGRRILAARGPASAAAGREGGYRLPAVPAPRVSRVRQPGWPLLLFLHGSGERGDDIARVKVHGPPEDRRPNGRISRSSPFRRLLPADEDWDIAKLEAILDHIVARYRIDRSRIYLTGLSRGGHATWRWGAAQPGRFAAIVPVSGRGDPSQACKLKQTPLWAFHGDRDDIVTPFGSFAMVEAVRSCGGKPRLTIYPDTGHDAWTRTYDDPALYAWLLEHSLPTRQPQDKK